jgi:hypothetical protein
MLEFYLFYVSVSLSFYIGRIIEIEKRIAPITPSQSRTSRLGGIRLLRLMIRNLVRQLIGAAFDFYSHINYLLLCS